MLKQFLTVENGLSHNEVTAIVQDHVGFVWIEYTREMLKRGYTEEEIDKVWGGNFFRAFAEVEKVAKK